MHALSFSLSLRVMAIIEGASSVSSPHPLFLLNRINWRLAQEPEPSLLHPAPVYSSPSSPPKRCPPASEGEKGMSASG